MSGVFGISAADRWAEQFALPAYLGLVLVLTWQALRGQSVIAPDGLTLSALGALLEIVLMVVVGVLARPVPRIHLHARSTATGGAH